MDGRLAPLQERRSTVEDVEGVLETADGFFALGGTLFEGGGLDTVLRSMATL